MELTIVPKDNGWDVHVEVFIVEPSDAMSSFRMVGDAFIPKAQCPTPDAMRNTVQGAVSHMLHRMINSWRVPLMHRLRDTIIDQLQGQTGDREAIGSATSAALATDIADGVVPTPLSGQAENDTTDTTSSSECNHHLIYAGNDGTGFGKCCGCETLIPVGGYAQLAARAEGFLTRVR